MKNEITDKAFDWSSIKFKECEVHQMIRYAGDVCPVCAIEADRKLLETYIVGLEMGRATAAAE